eukprot:Nitzschia sp. Nitz4//scaffold25_size161228//69937//70949//NITZ4_002430-RA/size161228-snap-gene-0.24-mRNA-1//-1//CDS//3329544586//9345//frame0
MMRIASLCLLSSIFARSALSFSTLPLLPVAKNLATSKSTPANAVAQVNPISRLFATDEMISSLDNLTVREYFTQKAAPKIVTLCGSQRVGSFNQMLHNHAVGELQNQGAEVIPVDLTALNLPMFNPEDMEVSFPGAATAFKQLLEEAEYNGFTTPLLYNSLTWASVGEGGSFSAFKGKCAAVMATSPGQLGGLRMIRSLQMMLADLGVIVVPGLNAIGHSMSVFDAEGNILDEGTRMTIKSSCEDLVHFCRNEANRGLMDVTDLKKSA